MKNIHQFQKIPKKFNNPIKIWYQVRDLNKLDKDVLIFKNDEFEGFSSF